MNIQRGGDEGSNCWAPRDLFCSIGFCLIAKGILLGNVISLSLGNLNAILGGAGLKGMSPRGLENCARIKKWGNNGRKSGRITLSNQKEADEIRHVICKQKLPKVPIKLPRSVKSSKIIKIF